MLLIFSHATQPCDPKLPLSVIQAMKLPQPINKAGNDDVIVTNVCLDLRIVLFIIQNS